MKTKKCQHQRASREFSENKLSHSYPKLPAESVQKYFLLAVHHCRMRINSEQSQTKTWSFYCRFRHSADVYRGNLISRLHLVSKGYIPLQPHCKLKVPQKVCRRLNRKPEEYKESAHKTHRTIPETNILTMECWILKG